MIDIRRFASMGENPLDNLETSYWPDPAAQCDSLGEEWAEALRLNRQQCAELVILLRQHLQMEVSEAASKLIIPVLTYIMEPRGNKVLRYYAFLMAAGDISVTLSNSYTEIAKRIGVTKAALSKAVIEIQKKFNIKGYNDFQKSDDAREAARQAANQSWKHRHQIDEQRLNND